MTIRHWSSLPPRKRKIISWAFGILLLYTITGFFLLPPIIRAIAIRELSAQFDRKVSIQKIAVDPFAPSITIRGLLIADKDGEPFISWDELYVNFELSSVFAKAWTFRDISVTHPYARVRMNKDYSFNFSDLIQKFSVKAAGAAPNRPSKPFYVRVKRLNITGARISAADFTQAEPFRSLIGPMDFSLSDFRTEPDKNSSYWFAGTTDAGENFYWRGRLCLNPMSSQGEFSIGGIRLNKFAPLYQDFIPFTIRGGEAGLRADYRFELSASNRTATVTNAAFALWNFTLARPGTTNDIIELPHLAVTGFSADAMARTAEIGHVKISGAKVFLERERIGSPKIGLSATPNGRTVARTTGAVRDEGIPALLASLTNAAELLLESTNDGTVAIRSVAATDCAVFLADLANPVPARLKLDQVDFEATNISNIPGTNVMAKLSLRWNNSGTIEVAVIASLSPLTADVRLDLSHLDLNALNPYLESQVNIVIPSGNFGLTGDVRVRTPPGGLPGVTFEGNTRLDDFSAVDSVMGEELLKWRSIQVEGIEANVNPLSVSIRKILLNQVSPHIVIETNGAINLLMALHPAVSGAGPTNAPVIAKAATAPATRANSLKGIPTIFIAGIVITNTQIYLTDRSVRPYVNVAILEGGGTINGLTTTTLQHGDIDLHALVDGVGPASVTGHFNPFNGSQTNLLKISLHNMDLLPASPYSGKFAGYRIARGDLNLDLDYQIVGRKLKSQNLITLDQFTFGEKVNSPAATKLPVRLAIAILKDRNGKIVLDVPIEGSLDDPKFRIGKVVARALENILTKVATSPFSLLGAAFGGGGEELSYDDFSPGSAELTSASRQKLDVLVKALYNRPGLQLEVSGSVNSDVDRGGLEKIAFEKELRLRQWQSLRKSQRDLTTPDEVDLTAEQRNHWINTLYGEAVEQGKITPALLAANTNLAAMAAHIEAPQPKVQKLAALLSEKLNPVPRASGPATGEFSKPELILSANPKEALLMAIVPVSDSDLEALAMERARAVRDYLLESGKVTANRLFLAENESGGLRNDGSRVYLQLQ